MIPKENMYLCILFDDTRIWPEKRGEIRQIFDISVLYKFPYLQYVCIILHQNPKSNFKNVDGFSRGEFGSINAVADCSCSLMDFISEWT